MVTFELQYQQKTGWDAPHNSASFKPINGAVFPYTYGQFLDDQLDEAHLTVYGSSVKPTEIPVGTLVSVTCRQIGKTDVVHYYRISGINSIVLPNNTNFYKHELALIEATKELELINCQTLTFTGEQGNIAYAEKWVSEDAVL